MSDTAMPKSYFIPVCPFCGKQCEVIYYRHGCGKYEPVGCEHCIGLGNAYGEDKCFPNLYKTPESTH